MPTLRSTYVLYLYRQPFRGEAFSAQRAQRAQRAGRQADNVEGFRACRNPPQGREQQIRADQRPKICDDSLPKVENRALLHDRQGGPAAGTLVISAGWLMSKTGDFCAMYARFASKSQEGRGQDRRDRWDHWRRGGMRTSSRGTSFLADPEFPPPSICPSYLQVGR